MSHTPTEADKWYETYYSIIYQPPGEIPQTKGPWTSPKPLEEMLAHLEKEEAEGTSFLLVDSRCGTLSVTSLKEHRMMQEAYAEAYEAEREYKRIGKCSGCGACSAKEAETKCRPTQYPSGDYDCPGVCLWENEEEQEVVPCSATSLTSDLA